MKSSSKIEMLLNSLLSRIFYFFQFFYKKLKNIEYAGDPKSYQPKDMVYVRTNSNDKLDKTWKGLSKITSIKRAAIWRQLIRMTKLLNKYKTLEKRAKCGVSYLTSITSVY